MTESCDILIIGGGPAGLAAGNEAVKAGLQVTIVERNSKIGTPVHCAEGVTYRSLHRVLTPKPEWILTQPKLGRLVAPNGRTVDVSDPDGGYVLDRQLMETDLAAQFVKRGGTLRLNCRGLKLIENRNQFEALEIENELGEIEQIKAKLFIAADGVEGTIARLAGISNNLTLATTDAYVQYRLRLPELDPDKIEIHLGRKVAPGSYAWVFPRSSSEANVGLGVLGSLADGSLALGYLDQFVKKRFAEYEILKTSCGTAPRYAGLKSLSAKNLLITGDSARLVDAITGGGICTALHSGILAVRSAVRYLQGDFNSIDQLGQDYSEKIIREYESELKRLLTLKKFFAKLSDQEINDIIEMFDLSFDEKPEGDLDLFGFVLKLIRTKPRLIKLARHIF